MWREVDTVRYYIDKDFEFKSTLAIFSLTGTLIKPISKQTAWHYYNNKEIEEEDENLKNLEEQIKNQNKEPTSEESTENQQTEEDINQHIRNIYKRKRQIFRQRQRSNFGNIMIMIFDNIKEKLTEIHEKGASIIVYHSCDFAGEKYMRAFELLKEELQLPIVAFFSTCQNRYSKPFTGMWQLINLFYKKENKTINKETSMYIGNLAGRLKYDKKRLDASCDDRAFAHNIGMNFTTPERFFLNNTKLQLWSWDSNVLGIEERENVMRYNKKLYIPIILDEVKSMPKSNQYTIVIIGVPSCGKTTLAKKVKRKWDAEFKLENAHEMNINIIESLSGNTLSIDEIITKLETNVSTGKSTIIDITTNNSNLLKIIRKSMEYKTPILLIEFQVNIHVAKLLNCVKIQTSNKPTDILFKEKQWDEYYKNYTPIDYKKIPCIKYLQYPVILQNSEALWLQYKYINNSFVNHYNGYK